jgi:hypothetical protein
MRCSRADAAESPEEKNRIHGVFMYCPAQYNPAEQLFERRYFHASQVRKTRETNSARDPCADFQARGPLHNGADNHGKHVLHRGTRSHTGGEAAGRTADDQLYRGRSANPGSRRLLPAAARR